MLGWGALAGVSGVVPTIPAFRKPLLTKIGTLEGTGVVGQNPDTSCRTFAIFVCFAWFLVRQIERESRELQRPESNREGRPRPPQTSRNTLFRRGNCTAVWGKLKKLIQVKVLPLKIEKTGTENHLKPPELRAPEANRDGRPRQLLVRPDRLFRRGECSAVWGKLKNLLKIRARCSYF